jgi:hypothetical protein
MVSMHHTIVENLERSGYFDLVNSSQGNSRACARCLLSYLNDLPLVFREAIEFQSHGPTDKELDRRTDLLERILATPSRSKRDEAVRRLAFACVSDVDRFDWETAEYLVDWSKAIGLSVEQVLNCFVRILPPDTSLR